MAKIDEEDQDYYLQNNSPEYFEKEILNQINSYRKLISLLYTDHIGNKIL